MPSRIPTPIRNFFRLGVSPTSLQFRLTLELVTLSAIGVSAVAFWAGWQMEQNLLSSHKQLLEYVAMRFPEQVEMYSEGKTIEVSLERTIDKLSTSGVSIWVKEPDGKILRKSSGMNMPSIDLVNTISQTAAPVKPTIVQYGDRYLVLCGNPLTVNGMLVGKVYLSQDITSDRNQLTTGIHSLIAIGTLAICLLTIAISQRIRKTLQPLAQMSQIASNVSADDLSAVKLELQQAPDEILGLAIAFNEMTVRLSGAWEQQRQFVGNVSHELRTPLSVVLGYLQSLLRRGDNLNPHQQNAVSTAIAETDRTIRMLQDLLDLARADSGNLHFRHSPVFLNTLVAETIEMSQKVSNRQITMIPATDDIVALADQDRLTQVLINLVDNAIKYSSGSIDLILEQTEDRAIIHVQDRGIGISLEHQNRIFERFYRAQDSSTRSRDGTGLGLAIAKSLIEGMNGKITLRSKPNEGSIFTIALPIWKPSSVSNE
ncbi:HAMP domain-containing sensor histidine kinase [Chamaesiphon sp. VAR_48_metabat_135_sub]|uniref:sensor histidine kinase n=1 Tax=Chamaesiphon sp. VAR_48_metabat_135_sub TaxID=2964699 RepID=UPI00286D41E9|nr:HAMP domain-containing sensor histidine kinase [Chamaesiphon sp. VAR_48_metabat_135_sub]